MAGVMVKVLAAEVLARLQGMEKRGGNLSVLFKFFGGYMRGSIEANFRAGGRPIPWAPLKIGTLSALSAKRSSYTGKKGLLTKEGRAALEGRRALIDTSLMMNTVYPVPSGRGLQMVSDRRAGRVSISVVQQLGAKIPPIYPKNKKALAWPGLAYPVKHTKGGVIPPRPFMMFQDEDINYFDRLLAEYVMTGRLG